jgi:hypothetical protein
LAETNGAFHMVFPLVPREDRWFAGRRLNW